MSFYYSNVSKSIFDLLPYSSPEILTMNMTHTGEQGYVLYIPNEFAVEIYDSIIEAGKEFGIRNCGYFAMRALRIEKFYAFWGQDIDSYTTPVECGRNFRTKVHNNIDFIGRPAIEKQAQEGVKKALVMFILDDPEYNYEVDPWPWGGEPIFRDGKFVGSITTCSFGFSLKKHVGLGYLSNPDENGDMQKTSIQYVKSGAYEVEIAGRRFQVKARLTAPKLPNLGDSDGVDETGLYKATQHER